MSSKKTIQINPVFFRMKNTKKRREKKTKPKFNTTLKPNNIKKQLLQKIKEHQQSKQNDKIREDKENKANSQFKDNFSSSLDYLQKMIQEKKDKKKKRREKYNNKHNSTVKVNNNPSIISGNQMIPYEKGGNPKWGCLKGGKLPTFSQYNKTIKNNRPNLIETEKIKISSPLPSPTPLIKERQKKLLSFKNNISKQKMREKTIHTNKTLKIFSLGKKNNKVGVLIKSGKTRKRIKDEVNLLKKKSITEIKKYLRKHNLIKSGSAAPENILRQLFEDSYLAGDIYNKNSDNLLHNYIND
jgi:hypothetical protein